MFKLTPVTSKIGQGHPSSNLTKTLLRYSWLSSKMDELDLFLSHRGQFKHENLQFFACKHDNLTNINRIGPKLIPWMYLKSVLVKFEDG